MSVMPVLSSGEGFHPKDILHGYDYVSLILKKRTGDGLWKGR